MTWFIDSISYIVFKIPDWSYRSFRFKTFWCSLWVQALNVTADPISYYKISQVMYHISLSHLRVSLWIVTMGLMFWVTVGRFFFISSIPLFLNDNGNWNGIRIIDILYNNHKVYKNNQSQSTFILTNYNSSSNHHTYQFNVKKWTPKTEWCHNLGQFN